MSDEETDAVVDYSVLALVRKEIAPVRALAEKLEKEKEEALLKARTAEAQAEASRLQCIELSKAQKSANTWSRQLKIDQIKAKFKSFGDQRSIEYLKWEVSSGKISKS